MDHIETAILNCYGIREAEQNMVFAARLTQHGHTIQSMPYKFLVFDFSHLYFLLCAILSKSLFTIIFAKKNSTSI